MAKVEDVKENKEEIVVEEPVEVTEEVTEEGKKERAIRIAKDVLKIAGIITAGIVTFGIAAAIIKGSKTTDVNPIENVDYTVEK